MSEDLFLMAAMLIPLAALYIMRPRDPKKKKKLAKGEEPDPICGCGHHLAFHTAEGQCREQIPLLAGAEGGQPKYDVYDCTCQQYVGPVPAISPQIMRELSNGPGSFDKESGYWLDGQHRLTRTDASQPSTEPYSQDK